ncbi:MAG: RNA polymerase sigma factor SigZ [Opitutus sp.]|nr:RNA polymerase sigma factor SigZ [Opitutus sp.]
MIAAERETCVQEKTGELWREFAEPLRRFLWQRVNSAADAEDLLQHVFVRIHAGLPKLHDTSKLQGWVYRIARNVVIDFYRARREHVPLEFEPESDDPTGDGEVDLRPSLRRLIGELPAPYRVALVRHEFQGESIEEVARALGLSLTATKSRVRRARLQLREMLDRCCRFEFDRRGKVISATPRSAKPCRC